MAEVWQATITDGQGNIIPRAVVQVRDEATGELAEIFADVDGDIPQRNPFFADDVGFARFYAESGLYRIRARRGAQERVYENVLLGSAAADYYVWQHQCSDNEGNALSFASVEIRDADTNALATLYADEDGTVPVANPFAADADGVARCYTVAGVYKITVTRGVSFSQTYEHVVIGSAPLRDVYAWQSLIVDETGVIQPGASIRVTAAATGAPAILYSDDSLTPLSNPFAADEKGFARFYAASGTYEVRVRACCAQRLLSDVRIGRAPEYVQVVFKGSVVGGGFTWTVPEGLTSIDHVLLVGTGGSGDASGGGAGEVLYLEHVPVTPGETINGRVGHPSNRDTLFGSYIARAGGGGASQGGQNGNAGGSGSGGASAVGTTSGGASTAVPPGLGSPGGSGTGEPATDSRASGGGGGAGEAGGDATIVGGIGIPGKGGNGVYLGEIFGDDVGDQGWFGGGGGGGVIAGGRDIDPPAGGLGGGGRGVVSNNDNDGNGYDGMPNTGGGGGGGIGNFSGSFGGTGIVILRYLSVVYHYEVITAVGPFDVSIPPTVSEIDFLLVGGGGGGGGTNFGGSNIAGRGGGGAGGVLMANGVSVTPGSTISGYVGAGGAGGIADNPQTTGLQRGRDGESTTFGAYTAYGGGGGGPSLTTGTSDGADGGSGGGAGFNANSGGSGTSGQGNNGGSGASGSGGAGGGGAGAAGGNTTNAGGAGGAGVTLASLVFGGAVDYGAPSAVGGGGGGGRFSGAGSGGAGGLGGGGAGGAAGYGQGADGTPNTGGGGGGSGGGSGTNNVAGQKGGNGGSGLAIVRWRAM